VLRACEKRPISASNIEEAMEKIEHRVLSSCDKEVSSHMIGEIVMDELKKLDDVAYVRFASVYRQFKDINTFMDELKLLLDDQEE
jgi:transcriptional repressor NrdR